MTENPKLKPKLDLLPQEIKFQIISFLILDKNAKISNIWDEIESWFIKLRLINKEFNYFIGKFEFFLFVF